MSKNSPLWTLDEQEPLRLAVCSTAAPFEGYLAFHGGRPSVGFRLLFSEQEPIPVTCAVVCVDDLYMNVWLEFAGQCGRICLANQAEVIHAALLASKECGIIARGAGLKDKCYGIPVRIESLKEFETRRGLEVSHGSRFEDVSGEDGLRRHAQYRGDRRSAAALL